MQFPVGTKFNSRGRVCTVIDYHVTRNLAGEVVRSRYVATHEFLGQTVVENDITPVAIARGFIKED